MEETYKQAKQDQVMELLFTMRYTLHLCSTHFLF